jgi:hypothetical protein
MAFVRGPVELDVAGSVPVAAALLFRVDGAEWSGAGWLPNNHRLGETRGGSPFPVTHTVALSDVLVSQSGAASNTIVLADMRITVDAEGVPTATVDHWRLECRG